MHLLGLEKGYKLFALHTQISTRRSLSGPQLAAASGEDALSSCNSVGLAWNTTSVIVVVLDL